MDVTDGILLLIAALIAIGLGLFVWNIKRRERETETMRTAMHTIANSNHNSYFKAHEAIPVTLDKSVNSAIKRFVQTAVDMQGMIELMARYMVSRMDKVELEDMQPPEEWTRGDVSGRR